MIDESVYARQDIHAAAQDLGRAPMVFAGEQGKGWILFHLCAKLDACLPADTADTARLEEILDGLLYLARKYAWRLEPWPNESLIARRNREQSIYYMFAYMYLLQRRIQAPVYIGPDPFPEGVI